MVGATVSLFVPVPGLRRSPAKLARVSRISRPYPGAVAGDGDGWTRCAAGHRHWGRFGAAGLALLDGARVLMQHRAVGVAEGDRWAVPGGARDSHETNAQAALREAHEEAGVPSNQVMVCGEYCDDHGGWGYVTVVGRLSGTLDPAAPHWESVEHRWIPVDQVADLDLHPGFRSSWPQVRRLIDAAIQAGARG